ncbi:hypothetical protein [Methanobacterium spitsbergense]|uniref:Uncharacterized protein n=1 Tax=Methanobacterium spitsbergense TaxID=2874285 RepID=A0A8T5USK0_9EURY|nr:hypothetical protein [Methanobacterium spitsbergense]MBZ2167032.1 hypothetical protein [Methanobacterium spitsbergense]
MNKKILILIILVAVIGIYGLFYVAVTNVLMPMELDSFNNDLNGMPQLPVNNNSTISDLENSADIIESNPSLKFMSQSQRSEMANQMRNLNSPPIGFLNQNFTDYNNFYAGSVLAYKLIGKGTLANEISNLSNITNNLSSLTNESAAIDQKSANDFENGDDKAYAEDLRSSANNLKQYNKVMENLKTQLQKIINQLGG